jgi:hypothetical protein
VELSSDCDDEDAGLSPAATELWYDGVDQDCSGGSDFDQDGDGVELSSDCDDEDAHSYPGAEEQPDGLDNDCDGLAEDHDSDGDGWTDLEEAEMGSDPFDADDPAPGVEPEEEPLEEDVDKAGKVAGNNSCMQGGGAHTWALAGLALLLGLRRREALTDRRMSHRG